MIFPVVLSGGSGTRLWPLSREHHPKQLLALVGESTMLQQTLERLQGLPGLAPALVICNDQQRFMVAEQLRLIGQVPGTILLEPVGRNTAPAVAMAALVAIEADPEAVLLVLPADHVMRDPGSFRAGVLDALPAAEAGRLVTFGVVPERPETGYGYIRMRPGKDRVREVEGFVEKPPAQEAERMLGEGGWLWNSGMFLFKASAYLAELSRLAPDIEQACRSARASSVRDLDFTRIGEQAFAECRAQSIDYAVMERTALASVLPLEAGWSDVGSWASLKDALAADASDTVRQGDVVDVDSSGCLLFASHRLLATVGLKDHVVVETKDAVLVAARDRVQDVKALVERLREAGRGEVSLHREVFRPWGSYDSVDAGQRFQVKRLVVKPGASMSLQLHHHRAEHWIVVSGTARITRNEEVFLLSENESTYIPVGARHRIENPGKVELHMIEVQSGSYLGEDDIVRFEDHYGRG
ncbi:MAG: mannose-1-phosphate guanylyltransferase/mannose-6-phosphate isomerase [Steroidobacteraceae bacterium]